MNFASAAAQIIPVLFLAVAFQAFGRPRSRAEEGTPYRVGIQWSRKMRHGRARWFDLATALGVPLAAIGGETLALLDCSPPLIAAAVAYLGVTVSMPQLLWAALLIDPGLARLGAPARRDAVLMTALSMPFIAAAVAGVIVAA